jgi:hypothetical protein
MEENSNTNHQAIIQYKGKWYFIYHNRALVSDAGSFHRVEQLSAVLIFYDSSAGTEAD